MVTTLACVLFVIALVLIYSQVKPKPSPPPMRTVTMIYCYDLNTKKLFAVPDSIDPPVETESQGPQPAGAGAFVFSCGSCYRKADLYIGWLEMPAKHLPKSNEPSDAVVDPDADGIEEAPDIDKMMVRLPKMDYWVPEDSKKADLIMARVNRCKRKEDLKMCSPRPERVPIPPDEEEESPDDYTDKTDELDDGDPDPDADNESSE